jgi:hypothetical protein
MSIVDKWYREGGRSDWVKAIDSWFNEIKIFPVESVSRLICHQLEDLLQKLDQ